MAAKGDDHSVDGSVEGEDKVISHQVQESVSNAEPMKKLDVVLSEIGANGQRIVKLTDTVEELRGKIFQLEQENDSLRAELTKAKERDLAQKCDHAFLLAKLADRKSEDTAAYHRRNNLPVYGVEEKANKSQEACERAVLELFSKTLQVKVQREDTEAVHRLGKKQQRDSPRGIMVHFISRCTRDQVIYARRKLRDTRLVIAEDLTPRTYGYALLTVVRDDHDVCQQSWTRYGRVFMKTHSGQVAPIDELCDLRGDQKRRRQWAMEIQVSVGASASGADTAGGPPVRSPRQRKSRTTASSQRTMSEFSVLQLFSQVGQKQ